MGFFADIAGKLKEAVRDIAPIVAPWVPGVQTLLRTGIISEPRTQSPLGAVLAGGSALASSIVGSQALAAAPPAPVAPVAAAPLAVRVPVPGEPSRAEVLDLIRRLLARIEAPLSAPPLPQPSPFLPQPTVPPQQQQQLPWVGMGAERGVSPFFW